MSREPDLLLQNTHFELPEEDYEGMISVGLSVWSLSMDLLTDNGRPLALNLNLPPRVCASTT